MPALSPLPIDPLLPEIVEVVRAGRNLVLEAEPGAGKTTRVPRALLDAGLLDAGECWVLEPRRLAARLAAARVAEELGEEPGQRAGYAVRFEQRVSRRTRIRFVTEGLLLRRFQDDPALEGISVVILDEFHERHVHTDLALTLLKRLQGSRRELRILVMSATLDAGPVAAFLQGTHLRSEGRLHPVAVRWAKDRDDRPLGVRVDDALAGLDPAGHTLVFLPGAAEIRQCLAACAGTASRLGLRLVPLHGSLSFEAQQRAIAPSAEPKVILSTNVAESSVTLEGVTKVIDSGLGREAFHSTWSGLSSLRTVRISQARCIQRAGRAGRTAPGVCLRLYTEADFRARPPQDVPELLRADLAEPLLGLHAHGIQDPAALPWFAPPPAPALAAAERLLVRLGALDRTGVITELGRCMAALPLHPRLARLVLAGEARGIPGLARLAAVLLEGGGLERRMELGPVPAKATHALESDLWARLDAFRVAEAAGFTPGACRTEGLDAGAVRQARQALLALDGPAQAQEPADAETRLLQALLEAFPDRVARRGGSGTYTLSGGGGARLDARSRVRSGDLILALEAEETSRGSGRETLIQAASRLEPEWLLECFPDAIRETEELVFDPGSGRVEHRSAIWYEDLCLDETRRGADPTHPGSAACLAAAALDAGFTEETLERLLDRVDFLANRRPDLGIPPRDDFKAALVRKACTGCSTVKELAGRAWGEVLREVLAPRVCGLLETWAPETVPLPQRRVKVHYDGEVPWIESRLQDFLGLKEGPRIACGQVPLVLHLLAPNHRAVQITTDLAGFWQRTYRELRPQLSRRYPKHRWPEDPG